MLIKLMLKFNKECVFCSERNDVLAIFFALACLLKGTLCCLFHIITVIISIIHCQLSLYFHYKKQTATMCCDTFLYIIDNII